MLSSARNKIAVELKCASKIRIVASSVRKVQSRSIDGKLRSYLHRIGEANITLKSQTYYETLVAVREANAGKTGWIFAAEGQRQMTLDEFHKTVQSLASGFLSIGIQKGDRVIAWMPSLSKLLAINAALATIGAVSAGVHPAYTQTELASAMNKVECKAIVTCEVVGPLKFYEQLKALIPELAESTPGQLKSAKFPFLQSIVVDSKAALPGCVNLNELFQSRINSNFMDVVNSVQSDDPFSIIFTSGTTGAAKAAVLTHHNVLNNIVMLNSSSGFASQRICNPLPLFHVFGLMGTMMMPLIAEEAVTITPSIGYDADAILNAIQTHKCTDLWGSPTMLQDVMSKKSFSPEKVKTIQVVTLGGNLCTEDIRRKVAKAFGCNVLIGYGATECTTGVTYTSVKDPLEKQLTTCGKPLPFTEVKIADPSTGKELNVNDIGEVWVRGYNIFDGYFGEPDKTAEVVTNKGWYKTGDLGCMDEEGYVSVVGRLKDLIIRGGENIHPIEIEELFQKHPSIADVYIIGVPDSRMGEEICAWIVLKPGSEQPTDEALREFCKGKISHFKIPRYYIFDPNVPRTAIAKAQKKKMREIAAQKLNLS